MASTMAWPRGVQLCESATLDAVLIIDPSRIAPDLCRPIAAKKMRHMAAKVRLSAHQSNVWPNCVVSNVRYLSSCAQ